MENSSWAILLCKFKDDNSEPFERNFYEDLFTSSGNGTQNMVDYFMDSSHGKINTGNSKVFGWYTFDKNRSEYAGNVPSGFNRFSIIELAKTKAIEAGVILSDYVGVVVCMNVSTDIFGVRGGHAAFCDSVNMQPSVLGQEMGHGYGLDHSRIYGSEDDYKDPWDTMSTMASFQASHKKYGFIGPGLNASNMRSREWLDESRVWKAADDEHDTTIELRPLHRRDLPGYLAAEIGDGLLVEFRMKEFWDAAIPKAAVLIHQFRDNHSYIMSGTRGQYDLAVGEQLVLGVKSPGKHYTSIKVESIDTETRTATIQLVNHFETKTPILRFPTELLIGEIIDLGGGTKVDGKGWVIIGGKVVPVPPWNPLSKILHQVAFYQSSDMAQQPHTRDVIRKEALNAIIAGANKMLERLDVYRTIAPRSVQRYDQKTDTYLIRGQVVNLDGRPMTGLNIECWDRDLIGKDDLLGSTVTDEQGLFDFSFNSKSFSERFLSINFDTTPSVYFKVFRDKKLLKNRMNENSRKAIFQDGQIKIVVEEHVP